MPALYWPPVTTDTNGDPITVACYKIYRCHSASPNCTKSNATFLAAVSAPTTSFNLFDQPTPSRFFVTAVSGKESSSSPTVKWT